VIFWPIVLISLNRIAHTVLNSDRLSYCAPAGFKVEQKGLLGRASNGIDPGSQAMPRRKQQQTTNQPADIFAPTSPNNESKRGPGRPPLHAEAWTKVTVVLFDRQIVFLDRLSTSIRAQSGAAISRAQLIRALVDAVADAGIDLSTTRSEADIKAMLLSRLGSYRLS